MTEESQWYPPTVTAIEDPLEFKSLTFYSPVPQALKDTTEPIVLGVDEAGRGPVLGPMVYGVAYSLKLAQEGIKEAGFADSKTLSEPMRRQLFEGVDSLNIGYATTTLTAKDISLGMLSKNNYNLNQQAHDTTIDLIRGVLARGVKVTEIYVDTVGPPQSYQDKLQKLFPEVQVTVAKKADAIYPIVLAASIVAKVTRDFNLTYYVNTLGLGEIGSGYPGDPNTKLFIRQDIDPVFGWPLGLLRFSWGTAKELLKEHVLVNYETDPVRDPGYGLLDNIAKKPAFIDAGYYGNDNVVL